MNKYLTIHPEVQTALQAGDGVVALESTIISHGMPFPENVDTALALEEIIRAKGAIPATIAIIDGQIHVGLTKEQLEFFGQSSAISKVSRRDLPIVIAQKTHGATTVAATMYVANLLGIKIFATGGIGGVHRGAETDFDISADLTELGMTNVAVVCAGAKAILDLALTLERLETLGVPVLGYQTDQFPAFYSRKSGLQVDRQIDTPKALAEILSVKWDLGLNGGVVIANPIPRDKEIPTSEICQVIETALKKADDLQIRGKEITPFLLEQIKNLTAGRSLTANIALVKNNARLAAEVAVFFAQIKKGYLSQISP